MLNIHQFLCVRNVYLLTSYFFVCLHQMCFFLKYWAHYKFMCAYVCFRIRTDHNIDNSSSIVENWISEIKHLYSDVDYKVSDVNKGML